MKPSNKARLRSVTVLDKAIKSIEAQTDQRRTAEVVAELIEYIMPKRQRLTEVELIFCRDMQEKIALYGDGLVASDKQVARLQQVKERLAGVSDGPPDTNRDTNGAASG